MGMIAVGLETDSSVRSTTRAQDLQNVDEKAMQRCDWPERGGLKTSQKVWFCGRPASVPGWVPRRRRLAAGVKTGSAFQCESTKAQKGLGILGRALGIGRGQFAGEGRQAAAVLLHT
jgi:hypothetical protein